MSQKKSKVNVNVNLEKQAIAEFKRLLQAEKTKEQDYYDLNWLNNLNKIDDKKAEEFKRLLTRKVIWECPPNCIESSFTDVKQSKVSNVDGAKCKDVNVPITFLNNVAPIPAMNYWTSIQTNLMVHDDPVLRNLPYLGDEEIEKHNLYDEILETYDVNDEEEQFFDDVTFVDLVNALIPYQQKEEVLLTPEIMETNSKIDQPFPDMVIFEAISAAFPNKGCPEKFKEKYIELTSCAGPNAQPLEYTPNIDGPKAESVSKEQILHSFKNLFCRRCYMYDCFIHESTEYDDPSANSPIGLKGPLLKPFSSHCSQDCYMLLDGIKEKLAAIADNKAEKYAGEDKETNRISNTIKVLSLKNENCIKPVGSAKLSKKLSSVWGNDENAEDSRDGSKGDPSSTKTPFSLLPRLSTKKNQVWTGSDQSVFRALRRTFLNNYCVIAQMMLTKTCRQVYEFAKNENDDITLEVISELPPPSNKKFNSWKTHLGKNRILKGKTKDGVSNSYTPCSHPPNERCDARCSCVKVSNFCEKFCSCRSDCQNRFLGCRCKRSQCNTNRCPCYFAFRECNPDLCLPCGADQFNIENIRCKNVNVQRGLRKHLLLAPSDCVGWGIFLKESVEKDEFISEYCGEIITHDEAERRGNIYEKFKCSYLFFLTNDFSIDATRKGNKIRFTNHSENSNCHVRIMMVNCDYRIGVFASRFIKAGEELFFNYRYEPNEEVKYFGIKRN